MNHTIYFLILSCLLLSISCGRQENKQENQIKINSSVPVSESTTLKTWLEFHGLLISDFDTLPQVEASFLAVEFQDSVDHLKNFFIFSPDSSQYIDLDSYGVVIENDMGLWKFRGTEPDSEVVVVNIEHRTRTRILFCGPACMPEDALWGSDQLVFVLGQSNEEGTQYVPFINVYDLKQRKVQQYVSRKPGKMPNEYIKIRMPEVIF